LEQVVKRYSSAHGWIEALGGVNLRVPRATIQAIIGFSGAGKSTLLRCISGLEAPDRGRVLVNGIDVAELRGAALREARRNLGVVFQQLHLLRSRSVSGNVALPLELFGWRREAIAQRVHELLDWFGIAEQAVRHPADLSGGQRQRVAIARALALQPAVMLTDEPTSALDPETAANVLDTLRRVRDEFGVTVVLVTHQLESVRAICDRVAVLDAGQIVEDGPVREVLRDPSSAAARRLLNVEPRAPETRGSR
jgi:D-methionine transport system ATP-binding protein